MDELAGLFEAKQYEEVISVLDPQFENSVIADRYVWRLNVRERLKFLKMLILVSLVNGCVGI